MRRKLRLAASLLAIAAIVAAIGVPSANAAENPLQPYTCTKTGFFGNHLTVHTVAFFVPIFTIGGWNCVSDAAPVDPPVDPVDPPQDPPVDPPADPPVVEDSLPVPGLPVPALWVWVPQRGLYCSLDGPVLRGDGTLGISLDLTDEQVADYPVKITPARWYPGIGATCDDLGGTFTGEWVDHVGDVVPGVAVYPLYAR